MNLDCVQLDLNGNSKICDFKACLNYAEKKKNNQVNKDATVDMFQFEGVKALEYKPPEIFTNGCRVLYSADYWALGVSIYKMLTGIFPFISKESITYETPYFYQTVISNEAKEFIKSLLNKNQFERLGSRQNYSNLVKNVTFFNGINWDKLAKRHIYPPFKPSVVIIFFILFDLHPFLSDLIRDKTKGIFILKISL